MTVTEPSHADTATSFPIISADSHITEPPNCYIDHIDPAFRDRAPRMVTHPERGDQFVVEGMRPISMGLVAAAGKAAEEITVHGVMFDELHRSGWDPTARLADQDRDGVAAEIIYPTVGMVVCNHDDVDFKKACFDAYNRWIGDYCNESPTRLLGAGQVDGPYNGSGRAARVLIGLNCSDLSSLGPVRACVTCCCWVRPQFVHSYSRGPGCVA